MLFICILVLKQPPGLPTRMTGQDTSIPPLPPRPLFESLPLRPDDPPFSAWDLYGPADEIGTLNLLTPARVEIAKAEIRTGKTISLKYALPISRQHDRTTKMKSVAKEAISACR